MLSVRIKDKQERWEEVATELTDNSDLPARQWYIRKRCSNGRSGSMAQTIYGPRSRRHGGNWDSTSIVPTRRSMLGSTCSASSTFVSHPRSAASSSKGVRLRNATVGKPPSAIHVEQLQRRQCHNNHPRTIFNPTSYHPRARGLSDVWTWMQTEANRFAGQPPHGQRAFQEDCQRRKGCARNKYFSVRIDTSIQGGNRVG